MKDYFIWLLKLVTVFVLLLVVVPTMLAATAFMVSQAGTTIEGSGKRAVAVIELKGEIADTKEVVSQLYKQAHNDSVDGIVLRIDSPGGGVAESQDVNTAVARLKSVKPIVASMGGVAASGGLYAAVSASKVFCQPGTLTGSIGVIMQVPNFAHVAEWAKVRVITVKSGQLKDVGNPFREMLPEEQKFLEKTLSGVHEEFITAVAEGRQIPRDEVVKFADGRVITGAQAKQLKLIDEFGDVYDAARAVYDIKKTPLKPDEMPTLMYPAGKFSQFRELLAWVYTIPKMFSSSLRLSYRMP